VPAREHSAPLFLEPITDLITSNAAEIMRRDAPKQNCVISLPRAFSLARVQFVRANKGVKIFSTAGADSRLRVLFAVCWLNAIMACK
jgi:hypothetical protein